MKRHPSRIGCSVMIEKKGSKRLIPSTPKEIIQEFIISTIPQKQYEKIIISLIAFTASLLNLGHSQFAVHSIIDSSGAYSFNYYEYQSWTVIPSLLLTAPNKHQSCQFTSKLWGGGNENKTINITSDSVKLVILLKKAANTKITHRYQATIRIPELNINLPGLYICYDDHKRIKEKKEMRTL